MTCSLKESNEKAAMATSMTRVTGPRCGLLMNINQVIEIHNGAVNTTTLYYFTLVSD